MFYHAKKSIVFSYSCSRNISLKLAIIYDVLFLPHFTGKSKLNILWSICV